MGTPPPFVAVIAGDAEEAPRGSVPIAFYAGDSSENEVIAALGAIGFGAAGQILATNSTGDGFEWIDAP